MAAITLVCAVTVSSSPAAAADKKPNILVIMGDDIGIWNISAETPDERMTDTPGRTGSTGCGPADHSLKSITITIPYRASRQLAARSSRARRGGHGGA